MSSRHPTLSFFHPTLSTRRHPSLPSLLDKLPPELLTRIARYLEPLSAASLALVCRTLSGHGTNQLWRHLDISAQLRLDNDRALLPKEREELKAAERTCILAKMGKVAGQAERLPLVRTLKVLYCQGSTDALAQLLESVSANIQSLDITLAQVRFLEWGSKTSPFNMGLLKPGLAFPSLTRVSLDRYIICDIGAVLLLCQIAPNISWLEFGADDGHRASTSAGFPQSLKTSTEIRRLHIRYSSSCGGEGAESLKAIVHLIVQSPHIETLFFVTNVAPSAGLAEAVAKLQNLRDIGYRGIALSLYREPISIPSSDYVRRVLLEYPSKWDFPGDASFPSLEIAHISGGDCSLSSSTNTSFHPSSGGLPFKVGFAAWLRLRPRLRTIYFQPDISEWGGRCVLEALDNAEDEAANGVVTSMKYGSEEVFQVFLLLIDANVSFTREGTRCTEKRRIIVPGRRRYEVAHPGVIRQSFTHYKGAMVPLQVLQQVRAMADPERTVDWLKRGVEVGATAWKVLEDWRGAETVFVQDEVEEVFGEDVQFHLTEKESINHRVDFSFNC